MQASKVIAIIISVLTFMIIGAISLFIYAFFHLHHHIKNNTVVYSTTNLFNQNIVLHIPYKENIISISDTHICSACLLIITGKQMIKSHIFIVNVNTGHIQNIVIKRSV